MFTEGTKAEFRGKQGICKAFSSLAKCEELRCWFCLIRKVLTGQYSVLPASSPILSLM